MWLEAYTASCILAMTWLETTPKREELHVLPATCSLSACQYGIALVCLSTLLYRLRGRNWLEMMAVQTLCSQQSFCNTLNGVMFYAGQADRSGPLQGRAPDAGGTPGERYRLVPGSSTASSWHYSLLLTMHYHDGICRTPASQALSVSVKAGVSNSGNHHETSVEDYRSYSSRVVQEHSPNTELLAVQGHTSRTTSSFAEHGRITPFLAQSDRKVGCRGCTGSQLSDLASILCTCCRM